MTIPRNLSILAEGANATGVLSVGYGGTGLASTPANGALDIGNGTGFTRTTLTAGSNITITNGAGSISIAASSSGAPTQGGFRSASDALYIPWGSVAAAASITLTQFRIYYLCFVVGQSTTFTKIGTYVTTGTASTNLRLGIYNWSNGIPTTRVLDAGTVAVNAIGIVEATISQTLAAGVYALACVCDGSGKIRAASGNAFDQGFEYGWSDMLGNYTFCLYETGASATLPGTATTTPTAQTNAVGANPVIYLRV